MEIIQDIPGVVSGEAALLVQPESHLHYQAWHLADTLDLMAYRHQTLLPPHHATKHELYYHEGPGRFMYLLPYGVVVLCGFSPRESTERLQHLRTFSRGAVAQPVTDDFEVVVRPGQAVSMSFDVLTLGALDHAANQMIMLLVAQSVVLDHYDRSSQQLITEIRAHTEYMEKKGKIKLTEKESLRFVGKSLTTKNRIVENLYILDAPAPTWDDEYLNQLYWHLWKHFELGTRYRAIENILKIMEENLSVFINHHRHRESSRLEWIIIILIVIEVVDTLGSKVWGLF